MCQRSPPLNRKRPKQGPGPEAPAGLRDQEEPVEEPGEEPVDPKIRQREARHRAVAWLSRREYGTGELRSRLARAGFAPETVEVTVSWLLEHDLLSNERFAEAFCRRRASQGYGPARTLQEMRARGVASHVASAAAAAVDWQEAATVAYLKRFGPGPVRDLKDRAKRQRYLAQRGFSHDIVRIAIRTNESENPS